MKYIQTNALPSACQSKINIFQSLTFMLSNRQKTNCTEKEKINQKKQQHVEDDGWEIRKKYSLFLESDNIKEKKNITTTREKWQHFYLRKYFIGLFSYVFLHLVSKHRTFKFGK